MEYVKPEQITTITVNAFGGPGAGKTTCSWEIASALKKEGLCVEYVSEYAKELVWDNNMELLDGSEENQRILLKEQKKRQDRLVGKVDVIVTDSPLLLNILYCNHCTPKYEEEIIRQFESYQNFNFFVNRDEANFEQRGRIHNLDESLAKDKEIKALLAKHQIYYGVYNHKTIGLLADNIIKTFYRINKIEMDGQKKIKAHKSRPRSAR